MSLIRISQPVAEPVSLAAAKLQLRVKTTSEDALIWGKLAAARAEMEHRTERAFIDQTWEMQVSCFSSPIEIPRPPMIEVLSVKYLDEDEAEQTLATDQYVVVPGGDWHGTIHRATDVTWPDIAVREDAVRIRFRAGWPYAGADDSPPPDVVDPAENVPADIKEGILLLMADRYENRQDVLLTPTRQEMQPIPNGVAEIVKRYKVPAL